VREFRLVLKAVLDELWRGATPRGCRELSSDFSRCIKGMNALQTSDPVVFCSSEEKRAWKQRHEGSGSERSTALCCIRTLKV